MTERTVQKALVELEKLGLIAVKERFRKNGSQTTNGYTVFPQRFGTEDAKAADTEAARPRKQGEHRSPGGEHATPRQAPRSRRGEARSGAPSAADSPMNPQENPELNPKQPPPPQPRKDEVPALPEASGSGHPGGCPDENGNRARPDLVIPDVIGTANKTVAMRVIGSLSHAQQQEVLDELCGRAKTSQVRNAIGYLRALVREMKSGTFTPDFAPQVRSDREARARNLQAYEARLASRPIATPAPPSAETRAKLQELLGRLAKPPTA